MRWINPLNQPAQTIKPPFNPNGARVSVKDSKYSSTDTLFNTVPYTHSQTLVELYITQII